MSERRQGGLDYAMSTHDADYLKMIVLLPADARKLLLERYERDFGAENLRQMFAAFIGMANAVVANNREMVELLLITDGNYHPHTAEKANLPTIFGALCGVSLAEEIDASKICAGCAYRLGTPANQSPVTTDDAQHVLEDDHVFMCHEDIDERGVPLHACPGYAQALKRRRKATV